MVAELSKKFTFSVDIIKKPEMPFINRRSVNEFPSVAINDKVIFRGQDVSIEELKSAIIRETGKTDHLP